MQHLPIVVEQQEDAGVGTDDRARDASRIAPPTSSRVPPSELSRAMVASASTSRMRLGLSRFSRKFSRPERLTIVKMSTAAIAAVAAETARKAVDVERAPARGRRHGEEDLLSGEPCEQQGDRQGEEAALEPPLPVPEDCDHAGQPKQSDSEARGRTTRFPPSLRLSIGGAEARDLLG